MSILEVKNLRVSFHAYAGRVQAVRGVSFSVDSGETLAIVGESGCGKSVTAQSVMRLLESPPARLSGSIMFDGIEIMELSEKQMRAMRGSRIAMIFQDPMTSLDPTMTVGKQITEGILQHQRVSKREATERAVEILGLVGIPNPESQIKRRAYELSGGMRQRVVIAMALVCRPELLIADEPTTALDVTTQAQILDMIRELKSKLETAVVLITHDMGTVSAMADRVAVFYAGKVVEIGSSRDIFYSFSHPYTAALLRSRPRLDMDRAQRLASIPGSPPDLFAPPKGCAFADRCSYAMEVCFAVQPEMRQAGEGHGAACWLWHEGAEDVLSEFKREAGNENGR